MFSKSFEEARQNLNAISESQKTKQDVKSSSTSNNILTLIDISDPGEETIERMDLVRLKRRDR